MSENAIKHIVVPEKCRFPSIFLNAYRKSLIIKRLIIL